MTSYETAVAFCQALQEINIPSWIVTGGVDIECKKHEVKKVMRVINTWKGRLTYLDLSLFISGKGRVYLVRREGGLVRILK